VVPATTVEGSTATAILGGRVQLHHQTRPANSSTKTDGTLKASAEVGGVSVMCR
jgi:hypothetical protein